MREKQREKRLEERKVSRGRKKTSRLKRQKRRDEGRG